MIRYDMLLNHSRYQTINSNNTSSLIKFEDNLFILSYFTGKNTSNFCEKLWLEILDVLKISTTLLGFYEIFADVLNKSQSRIKPLCNFIL